VPWTFFATSLAFAIPSLVNNFNLISKIYFPREILPLANIGAALLDFAIAWLLFGGLMVIYHIPLTLKLLYVIPLLLIQTSLTIGITLIGAAVIVFFRDVRFVIPLLTQIWMYGSPVIYPVTLVPARWQTLYFLNPMAGIISGYRSAVVLGQTPDLSALLVATIVSVALLLIGYAVFKRSEPLFADVI
jgi:lipopolysaccharide transport system permease protein